MNRFFSKLDLRDIKIDPEGSRFPPDEDDDAKPAAEAVSEVDELAASAVPVADTTDRYSASDPEPGATAAPVAESMDAYEPYSAEVPADPVASNGHLKPDVHLTTMAEQGDEILKVSSKSRPSAVAGAIAGVVRQYGYAEVQAIGAGATNQAVKAVAIARDYLRETGIDAVCLPAFIDVTIDNEDRTAIRILIEPR